MRFSYKDLEKIGLKKNSLKLLHYFCELTNRTNTDTGWIHKSMLKIECDAGVYTSYQKKSRDDLEEKGFMEFKKYPEEKNKIYGKVNFKKVKEEMGRYKKECKTVKDKHVSPDLLNSDLSNAASLMLIQILIGYFDCKYSNNGYIVLEERYFRDRGSIIENRRASRNELIHKGYIQYADRQDKIPAQYKINFDKLKKTLNIKGVEYVQSK